LVNQKQRKLSEIQYQTICCKIKRIIKYQDKEFTCKSRWRTDFIKYPIADEPICHNLVVVAVYVMGRAYPPELASFCTSPHFLLFGCGENKGSRETKVQLVK